MRNLAFALALLALAACNRDGAETRTSGANEQVIPTESMTTGTPPVTDSTNTLVPIGGTPTTGTPGASTITTQTPGAQTTTRSVTQPPTDAAPAPTGDIAAGQPLFHSHCARCHGGDGRKPAGNVVLISQTIQAMSEEDLIRRIRESPTHRTLALQQTELDAIAAYVRAIQ